MPTLRQSVRKAESEEGFILLMVLFLVVLLLIALAVAAPKVAVSIRRDKEIELIHRGEQYKRAIKLYYRKFGSYPTSIDQLLDTNNIRFLRKRYTDPITGKDDWRLIYLGQAKVPPMGFFGQPLGGVSGTIPGAVNIGTPVAGGTTSGTSGFGASSFGSSSAFGSSGSGTASAGGSGSTTSSSGTDDGSGTDSGSSSSGTGTNGTGSTGTSSVFASSDNPGSNPTIGGGPIMGVGIPSKLASLLEYKKQKHYNQWEFDYYPMEDMMQAIPTSGVSDNPGTTGTGFGNSTNGNSAFGSNTGNSGTGAGSSSGTSGTGSEGSNNSPTSPPGSSPDQQQQ